MKKFIITSIVVLLAAAGIATAAQNRPEEYLGLPGDNLNLYAVMNLFQESETLESFERKLNDENSRINNLDLNSDGYVDYIMVKDYVDGDVHTIVLQVALDRYDKQDVAVFTVQRFRDGSVQIQLIGDETLYGRNYIIEPYYAETPNPGYVGPGSRTTVVTRTTVVIDAWPVVHYIYSPGYVVWRSRWYWGYYPVYWTPWRPYYWHFYYGYHYHWHPHYYKHYRLWHQPRYTRYNTFYYTSIRTHSPRVVAKINSGNYRTTYSRPELRREGEALYSRVHSDRNTRTNFSSTSVSQGRRSVSTQSGERSAAGTGSVTTRRSSTATATTSTVRNSDMSRRSAPVSTERTVRNATTNQSTSASRREAPAGTGRESTGHYSGSSSAPVSRSASQPAARSAEASRRPAVTATQRQAAPRSSSQNISSARRSSATTSARQGSAPASADRSAVARRSAPSGTKASPAVRSSTGSRTKSESKSSDNARSSGSDQTSRRK